MNHLAHLLLSNYHEDILIGNFITDFIRKSQESQFSPEIQKGIQLHRMIDDFTDNHLEVKKGKDRLRKYQGKYGPVVLDICYDHLLGLHWNKFSDIHLDLFSKDVYATLERRINELPEKLQRQLPYMIKDNWLMSYELKSGLEYTFKRLAQRVKFDNQLATAVDDFYKDFEFYETGFLIFFPEIQEMSKNYCQNL